MRTWMQSHIKECAKSSAFDFDFRVTPETLVYEDGTTWAPAVNVYCNRCDANENFRITARIFGVES